MNFVKKGMKSSLATSKSFRSGPIMTLALYFRKGRKLKDFIKRKLGLSPARLHVLMASPTLH
jgi:hypothetical protein